ncbi:MAG: APC family permease, partial [Sphingomicrobium sp.]
MPASDDRRFGHLLRILGLAFGLAVVVGGVVGQGILRTPGIVAGAVPDPTLILLLWTLGGTLVLIDACAVVELGASIPRAGGPYALAERAYGRVGGTVVGWADWMISTLVVAFVSVVFGEYCHRLGIGTAVPAALLSVALIAACWAINWTGTRLSGASQTTLSAVKGFVLAALIVALFLFGEAPAAAEAAASPAVAPVAGVAALLVAMRAVVNTYGGWHASVYFGEEIVAPDRNIARSTFGGILLVTALYVGVNAALLHVLTPAQMAASELAVADAAGQVFGPGGELVITVLALVSLAAIANLFAMVGSRIGFAMARDGVLPAALARTSTSGTPRVALTIGALVAAGFALSGTYGELLSIAVPLTVATIGALDLAAIVMRRREPDLPRPFKMPLFPLPALVGLALNLILLAAMLIDDPLHTMIGVGAAVVLGIGYALLGRGRRAPAL